MRNHRLPNRSILTMACAVGIAGFLAPSPAFACSCRLPEPNQFVEQAGVIFGGRVVKTERIARKFQAPGGKAYRADIIRTTFQVDKVWKGQVGKTAVVITGRSTASCGWPSFGSGAVPYVVAKKMPDGTYRTGFCTMLPVVAEDHKSRFIAAINAYANQRKDK